MKMINGMRMAKNKEDEGKKRDRKRGGHIKNRGLSLAEG